MRFIDKILEILWNLLGVFGKAASLLLAFAVKIMVAFWDLLCDAHGLRWFTDRMNIVFVEIGNAWNSSMSVILREETAGFFLHLKNLIETSRRARNWFFIMLFAVLLFWFYPPYKWGPWYYHESGKASYYGSGFYFNRTASGERFLPFRYTAAHRTLPIGITVMVVNKDNHEKVYVQINDRGPVSENRIIDLSKSAAGEIGIIGNGSANVEIYTRKRYKK
ncbi:MAG: septal ring lytic transglycosylase RlpA family protein [Lentisphaerae bacterium]|nr:septal ring lytic transglycosylase RlpA family protein [Lentisphaerota bacterium]